MPMLKRRQWIVGLSFSALLTTLGGFKAHAFEKETENKITIFAPNNAVGTIVSAVTESVTVDIQIDKNLDHSEIILSSRQGPMIIVEKIRFKGAQAHHGRYLDDARNAGRLSANIRDQLSQALPKHATLFAENHRKWTRVFAHKTILWGKQLRRKLKGRKIQDNFGRTYLLEWGGAVIDVQGQASPPALGKIEGFPKEPTLEAYEAYIQALIAAVTK